MVDCLCSSERGGCFIRMCNRSQIIGVFYRTASLLEKGIKPVFVFDGPAPRMKSRVLSKRHGWTPVAQTQQPAAKENRSMDPIAIPDLARTEDRESQERARHPVVIRPNEEMESQPQRQITKGNADASESESRPVFVPRNGRRDCQRLLTLLGVPYIEAPSEAEATCAALVKAGKVHCTATEDMDALPFGCTLLVRNVNAKKDARVEEISLPEILRALDLTQEQFVDLCILMGCDYCDKIKGIGIKRALPLIQSHKSIEEIIRNIDCLKYRPPEGWPFKEARELFLQPEVVNTDEVLLEWRNLDEEGLVQLLVHEKNAKEKRVRNRIQKLRKSLCDVERRSMTFTLERQMRLDAFYTKVKTYYYKKEGNESFFRSTIKRRKAVKRNLSKIPLRRCVRVRLPQSKPAVPNTVCDAVVSTPPDEPQNIPETLHTI
ncbi:flap endonuclease 1-like isoform X2 [Heterodontus francisci]|uniref:flap endonuclease 1-like isoform X2 n=1 Tax=Heterodontus francisci TaxID=7792 RepID=UPI00355C6319